MDFLLDILPKELRLELFYYINFVPTCSSLTSSDDWSLIDILPDKIKFVSEKSIEICNLDHLTDKYGILNHSLLVTDISHCILYIKMYWRKSLPADGSQIGDKYFIKYYLYKVKSFRDFLPSFDYLYLQFLYKYENNCTSYIESTCFISKDLKHLINHIDKCIIKSINFLYIIE